VSNCSQPSRPQSCPDGLQCLHLTSLIYVYPPPRASAQVFACRPNATAQRHYYIAAFGPAVTGWLTYPSSRLAGPPPTSLDLATKAGACKAHKTPAICIAATAMSAASGAQAQQGPAASDRPKKLQRISQACDLCHRRSIRCRPSIENAQVQCQNCFDFGVPCTYNRPSRRRRNPSVSHGQATPPNILPHQHPQSVVRTDPSFHHIPITDTQEAQVADRGHLR